jgi:hypothetical protein
VTTDKVESVKVEEPHWRRIELRWTSYLFLGLYGAWLALVFSRPYGYDEYGWGLFVMQVPLHVALLAAIIMRARRNGEQQTKYWLYAAYMMLGFCAIFRYSQKHWYNLW